MRFLDPLIFDLDGTLWDASLVTRDAWNGVLIAHDIPLRLTTQDIRRVTGRPQKDCIDTLLGHYATQQLVREMTEAEERLLQEQGGVLYAGVPEVLDALVGDGHTLALVSNCEAGYLDTFFRTSGSESLFSQKDCAGLSHLPKADMLRIFPCGTYIGDTPGDLAAAREAGLQFIHAAYGFGEVAAPDASIGEIRALPPLLSA